MKTRCSECKNGIIIDATTCPDCKGTGSRDFSIGVGSGKGDDCPTCSGKGQIINKSKCSECVDGVIYHCDFCGNPIEDGKSNVCVNCEENPIVIQLGSPLDYRYLDGKNALAGKVDSVSRFEVRVDLGNGFIGQFKPPKEMNVRNGQILAVRLRNPLTREDRGKPVPVFAVRTDEKFKVVTKTQQVFDMTLEELMSKVGNTGKFVAQVIDIYNMRTGITLFTLMDNNGKTVQGSVYSGNESRAYPYIHISNVVEIVARYRVVNEKDRLQIFSVDKVKGNQALEFFDDLAGSVLGEGSDLSGKQFFVESSSYDGIKDEFVKAAKRIRTAVLRNQNIIIRYHSPCVDGVSGAFAVDWGMRQFMESTGAKNIDFRRLIRRLPQRNHILEVREVSRDLSFALDDGMNKNMPLYILVDVGSTDESKAALEICQTYGVDVIVVDSHHLNNENKELVHALINPNSVSYTEAITSGMLGVELAKFISPEVDLEPGLVHVAALSGFSDRVVGPEYEKYLELAEKHDYDKNRLEITNYALDYTIFGLRHFDGGEVVRNILGIGEDHDKAAKLIESITPTAKSLFATSLKIAQANSTSETLSSGSLFVLLNLDNFAPKYEYPQHSDIIAALHNSKIEEGQGQVITVGYTSDYLILRNSALDFNFNDFMDKVEEELLNDGVTGSGNKSAGSIQYMSGFKDKVIETLKKLL